MNVGSMERAAVRRQQFWQTAPEKSLRLLGRSCKLQTHKTMKQKLSITIRGKHHEWNFDIDADPKHLQEWRDDGLEINEVYNSIPTWLPAGLTRAWCFVQDCFYFRNPFKA